MTSFRQRTFASTHISNKISWQQNLFSVIKKLISKWEKKGLQKRLVINLVAFGKRSYYLREYVQGGIMRSL